MKKCLNCEKEVQGNRKKFCSDHCRYWFNMIKKDKEQHLPPVKKRNKNFFSMVTGWGYGSNTRQGKRSGHMVAGGMSARITSTNEEWAELTYDNLKKHFTCISFYRPVGIKLGDDTWIKEKDIFKETGVRLDF